MIKTEPAKPATYGMGWFTATVEGTPIEYHSGAWQGFRSMIVRYPKQKTGSAIMVNSDIPESAALFEKVIAAAAPGLPLPPR
ncbi:serine hydrolase [Novosphingobium sp. Chol11]|uniref:serine hydrolase n=1 Tax=Novosphingobium sp. Chol11 TaxID=1385763 RepID=UPI0025F2221B|nr:serine hydrolase [Novosphingobium sp. Chol11]